MRKLSFLIVIISVALYSCENNVEEAGFDCSLSDLSIAVASSVKSDCQIPGSITVEAAGGDAIYTYSRDGENFQTSTTFENIFAGQFTLTVKDGAGCTSSINFTLDSEPDGIILNLASSNSDCSSSTGTVTAVASGGIGSLQYSLDNGAFGSSSSFESISVGNHTVTVKDEEGCEITKSISVNADVSLENDIMPIVRQDCAISGCHNGSVSPRLTSSAAVAQNAGRIKAETQSRSMPRNRTLSQSEIDLIACWVDSGAINN